MTLKFPLMLIVFLIWKFAIWLNKLQKFRLFRSLVLLVSVYFPNKNHHGAKKNYITITLCEWISTETCGRFDYACMFRFVIRLNWAMRTSIFHLWTILSWLVSVSCRNLFAFLRGNHGNVTIAKCDIMWVANFELSNLIYF